MAKELCGDCDGCGWTEGGETLKTPCRTCNGSGEVYPTFVVAVFQHNRGRGRKPLLTAYTRYYNTSWDGCCMHLVRAENGTQAKREAIGSHKMQRGCRGPGVPMTTEDARFRGPA